MTETHLIRLSWPDPALSGNARGHWSKKARATRAYRQEAAHAAYERGLHMDKNPQAVLDFFFFPPDRRRRDAQNLPSMMKAAIDGIADAMGCDDHEFTCRFQSKLEAPVKGGSVLVRVSAGEEQQGIPA